MQVVEKSNEGLSRVYEVSVPKAQLAEKLEAKIAEVSPRVNLKGFRPGKVPPAHVRKMFGKELMAEIVQEALTESSQKALNDNNIRPAGQPDIEPVTDVEAVMKGEADLAYTLSVELMPVFEPVDPATLSLTRPVYEPSDEDMAEAMKGLLDQSKSYEAKGGKAPKAANDDKLTIDFVGRIDGEAFEGGSAEGAALVIGSGQFIPGFEEQLVGAKKGEERLVKVTFPENYGAAHLAGKDAEFTVTVKAIEAPKAAEATEEFATSLGFENLDALNEAIKGQLSAQYKQAARFKLKRALLDALDEKHSFDLPSRMLEAEFAGIWAQVEQDRAAGNLTEEEKDKSEDELKADYRKIAERRVRLGLVLAEIGTRNNVTVNDQEVAQAIAMEARNYPGQERQVFDFYRQNPGAAAQIRAPIFEEKVCEYIFGVAQITEAPISKEDLFKDEDA